jgi:hypothetical protein
MLRVNDAIALKITAARCQNEGAGNRWRLFWQIFFSKNTR